MDDFLRDLRQREEYIRRLSEGPLRYLRENQAVIERPQELLPGIDFKVMSDPLAALDFRSRLPELVSTAALAKEAFSSIAVRDSVFEMQRFADQHREVYVAMDRAALPYKEIAEQVQAMSRLRIDARCVRRN